MEYICKIGTPAGEIVERSIDAPNEEALKAHPPKAGASLLDYGKKPS